MLFPTILGATLAYVALNFYLLAKIQPLPITFIPQTANYRSKTPERATA